LKRVGLRSKSPSKFLEADDGRRGSRPVVKVERLAVLAVDPRVNWHVHVDPCHCPCALGVSQ